MQKEREQTKAPIYSLISVWPSRKKVWANPTSSSLRCVPHSINSPMQRGNAKQRGLAFVSRVWPAGSKACSRPTGYSIAAVRDYNNNKNNNSITSGQIFLTKGRIACRAVIEYWMIPFAAYNAAEILMLFSGPHNAQTFSFP